MKCYKLFLLLFLYIYIESKLKRKVAQIETFNSNYDCIDGLYFNQSTGKCEKFRSPNNSTNNYIIAENMKTPIIAETLPLFPYDVDEKNELKTRK